MSDTKSPSAAPPAETPTLPRPKILKRPPPLGRDAPEVVPARMINEVLYCERLMYLEWSQGEFKDNRFTVEGRAIHRRADKPKPLPDAETVAAEAGEPPFTARSVWLTSERFGITSKIDIVDVGEDGRVAPVEYKRGKKPALPEGAHLPERAQLYAQVLVLRDNGYRCDEAFIYFAGDRQRVAITLDEQLERATLFAVRRARELVGEGVLPPPLDDSRKCHGCSLAGICLPDEVALLRRLAGQAVPEAESDPGPTPEEQDLWGPLPDDPWGLVGTQAAPGVELRRLHPARDDRLPVYVQDQGAKVSLSGERLIVRAREGKGANARLPNTSQVAVFGNVQITTQTMHTLLRRGIPLTFFTGGGWFLGRLVGAEPKNIELRVAQFRAADDPAFALRLARGFVASKILNCRTLLRRNHPKMDPVVLKELKILSRKAREATSAASLLGIEGTAARTYFGAFTGMLKGPATVTGAFDLEGRNRRPPRDPINALLSFAYALLVRELTVTLSTVGLDPMLGFYHRPRFGRPALALDLMEELRPLVADSVVITAINNGVVDERDFVRSAGAASLTAGGRKKMILAYERRMDQLITHPVFGYRISYRRVLEVQARLLGRLLLGEIDEYPPLRTR